MFTDRDKQSLYNIIIVKGGLEMKKLVSLFLIVIICISLSACATPEEKLVGRWERVSENRNVFASYLEFFSDGTYTSSSANHQGSFSISGNRIMFQGILVASKTFTYEIKGNKLTLYTDYEGNNVYAVYEKI